MQNENIDKDIQVPDTSDFVFDSPPGDEVTDIEDITSEEILEETVADGTEELEESEELNNEMVVYDYTETLLQIDEHLQLASARIEYCNCLLIIILLIILLQYVYKFFKLFF